jgi:hypothetical protein
MWLELKILLSIFAMVFIAVILSQVLFFNAVFAFILIAAIVMIFMGDVLIGYQIKHNHLDVLMDACPPGEEICVLFDFSGNIDFLRTRKGPLGTRQFVRYKKETTIINDGKYQVRFINGNHGFVGHESYDKNVSLYTAEALDKCKGDTLEEIVDNLPLVDRAEEAKKHG